MITRGEIISVNLNSNVFTVRVPIFETASDNRPVTVEALAIIPPGVFNGYKAGDIVEIGFENNTINKAVILGKFYLGTNTEITNTGGSLFGDTLNITAKATIPADTKLTSSIDGAEIPNMDTSLSNFSSIKDIINAINELKKLVGGENVDEHIKRLIEESK